MANVPYSVTDKAVTVFLKGQLKIVGNSDPNYKALRVAVLKPTHDETEVAELANINTFFSRLTHGRVEVGEDCVRWDGKPVHNSVPRRILALMDGGYDVLPLVKFLDKLMTNPTESARNELFDWLESGNNPLTPDGNILAFKIVRSDYKDVYTGTIDNSVGQKPWMPRSEVDPDRTNTCSRGLHFCSWGYLSHAYCSNSSNRTMVVEVDPADVVSIPDDYSYQKGRALTYKVVAEIKREQGATFFEGKPVVEIVASVDPSLEDTSLDIESNESYEVGIIKGSIVCPVKVDPGDDLTLNYQYEVLDINQEGDELYICDDSLVDWWYPADQFILASTDEAEDHEDHEDDEVEGTEPHTEVATTETVTTKVEKMFHVNRKGSFKGSDLKSMVVTQGQRGASRSLGIARSTLQGWLAQIG